MEFAAALKNMVIAALYKNRDAVMLIILLFRKYIEIYVSIKRNMPIRMPDRT